MKIKLLASAVAILVVLFAPVAQQSAQAQGGHHPYYLRALSDLRLARGYLDKLTPSERLDEDQSRAIHEIDEAINIIKHASIDDGKDIHDHMPIDARILPRSRFQKAQEALHAALEDCGKEEDDQYTKNLQKLSIEHIHAATQIIHGVMAKLHLL